MIVEIEDKLVSSDLFEKQFVCNLNACKGACCVKGDSGAPLTLEEVDLLEEHLEEIKPFMRPEGLEVIEKSGVFYMDEDNEAVTTLVNEEECVFVTIDEKGTTLCSVEQAYRAKKIVFNKPISCHLYPIRVAKLRKYEALNYNMWDICSDACQLGKKLGVKVYQFLKEPIIRKWGENFFLELEKVDRELEMQQ